MNKTKILQFPIADSNGGITHYAVNNFRHMDKEKFSCDFATISPKLYFEDDLRAIGAGVKYISCYAEDNSSSFSEQIRNLFIAGKYDIVHLHTSYWKSFMVEEIAMQCHVPKVIVHAHNTFVGVDNEQQRIEEEKRHNLVRSEFDISMATDFWACSNIAADWIFGPQIPKDRIKILKATPHNPPIKKRSHGKSHITA